MTTTSSDWSKDTNTLDGAFRLAKTIRDFWVIKGYYLVAVWPVQALYAFPGESARRIFTIKSNLVNGLPPKE